jgi:hypothetical protein
MKIEGYTQDEIADAARFVASNPILIALLSEMEVAAISKIVAASGGDDMALRCAAIELRAVRNVRTRLALLSKKDTPNG